MPAGDVLVTLGDDPVGWERLGVIVDVRTARDAGLIRWHDGHVQVRPELSAELSRRMQRHRDLLEHALTWDLHEREKR